MDNEEVVTTTLEEDGDVVVALLVVALLVLINMVDVAPIVVDVGTGTHTDPLLLYPVPHPSQARPS